MRYFALHVLLWITITTETCFSGQPNVIVVMSDDQGYGELSCHGNPVLQTPNLDRLHDESVRFTDFHVAPMCTPTRGQLMTGVDALRNGAMNVSSGRTMLRRTFPTMSNLFAASRWQTGVFGKWHLGDTYPYSCYLMGVDERSGKNFDHRKRQSWNDLASSRRFRQPW